jgi:site-specific recombinase XerD
MDDTLTIPQASGTVRLVERAAAYAKVSYAKNTSKAYESDLRVFKEWCEKQNVPFLPTSQEVLACYVAHLADIGRKVSTISRAVSTINTAHRDADLPLPKGTVLENTMSGIRRTFGTKTKQKAPVLPDDLRAMVAVCSDDLVGHRNRLLLVMGFCGAFRRSELVAMRVEDVVRVRQGLEVTLRKSKTDQEGRGRTVALPRSSDSSMCPEALFLKWLEVSGVTSGYLFRDTRYYCPTKEVQTFSEEPMKGDSVAKIVKGLARKAGLENAEDISGHSLRAGLVTAAAEAGRTSISIRRTTGHKSDKMVDLYVRSSDMWKDNAAKGLL